MKKEIAEKWVAALRSGEYQQTTKSLRRADGFCCLGVLCDVVRHNVNGYWGDGHDDIPFIVNAVDSNVISESNIDILPDAVMSFAGLTSRNPKVESICSNLSDLSDLSDKIGLTEVNDGDPDASIKPHSFEEIANIIEKEWEKL